MPTPHDTIQIEASLLYFLWHEKICMNSNSYKEKTYIYITVHKYPYYYANIVLE